MISLALATPLKGLRILVVGADIVADRLFKISDRPKCSSSNSCSRDFCEPAFDLVQPGGARRRKVDVVSRVLFKPCLHFWVFVFRSCPGRGESARIGRRSGINFVEKKQKLLMSMEWLALADHLANRHIQCGE